MLIDCPAASTRSSTSYTPPAHRSPTGRVQRRPSSSPATGVTARGTPSRRTVKASGPRGAGLTTSTVTTAVESMRLASGSGSSTRVRPSARNTVSNGTGMRKEEVRPLQSAAWRARS